MATKESWVAAVWPWLGFASIATLASCQSWMPSDEHLDQNTSTRELAPLVPSAQIEVRMKLFELSGVATVSDAVLVADDELVGSVYSSPLTALDDLFFSPAKIERKRDESAPFSTNSKLFALQDFEGLASEDDTVYLIGSHQPHGSGDRRSDREFLIKAKWDDEKLKFKKKYEDLLPDIEKLLRDNGMQLSVTKTTVEPAINIEGLAANEELLFVGVREPLLDGEAILLQVNEGDVFSDDPQFSLSTLALGGAGIRGLYWDSSAEHLLVLSGGINDEGDKNPEIIPGVWTIKAGEPEPTLIYSFTPEQLGGPAGEKRAKPEAITRLPDGRIAVFMDGEAASVSNVLYFEL